MKSRDTNEGTFISIQDIVNQSRQYSFFLLELHRSSKKIDCSLKPRHDTLELLDSNFCFGSVDLTQQDCDIVKTIPDISFPLVAISPSVKIRPKKDRQQIVLSSTLETIEEERSENTRKSVQEDKTRISLRKSVHVQSDSDTKGSLINGIAVSYDGKRILADFNNQNLKLFGPTMKFLSSFSLTSAARGVCYMGDNEIIVSKRDKHLLFMHISEDKLTFNRKLKVKCPINALACDENIYLFRGSNP